MALIFCFLDMLVTLPFTMGMVAPVWPLRSSCMTFEASNHQWTMLRSSAFIARHISQVPFRYCNIRISFLQPSLFGSCTWVVRKAMLGWMSGRVRLQKNSSLSIKWRNRSAWSYGRSFLLLVLKRWSYVGLETGVETYLGNYSTASSI